MKNLLLLCLFAGAAFAQPTALSVNMPKIQYFTNNGLPCAGCQVWSYQAGTTTLLATYVDSIQSAPNTNPVILDAAGRATIYLANTNYKIVLANDTVVGSSPSNIIWSVDNVYLQIGSGAGPVTGGITQLTGDVLAGPGTGVQAAQVVGLNGHILPAPPTAGWLHYTGTSFVYDTPPSSGGSPGGSNGQLQYNNAGAFGGFTMSGDCTIVVGTGVITCLDSNGTPFGTAAFAATTDFSPPIVLTTTGSSGPSTLAPVGGHMALNIPQYSTSGSGMAIGATVTSGTPCAILYIATGPVLAQDPTAFCYDQTNKRVSIGGGPPGATLELTNSDPSIYEHVTGAGNYGGLYMFDSSNALAAFVAYGNAGVGLFPNDLLIQNFDGGDLTFITGNRASLLRGRFDVNGNFGVGNTTAALDPFSVGTTGIVNAGTWQGSVIGSNYGGAGAVNGLLKANGSGVVSAAIPSVDYCDITCLLFTPPGTGAVQRTNNVKIAETTLSITDYGAVSGAANVSANFQNALNSLAATGADRLYIPCGTWNLPTAVTVPSNVEVYGPGSCANIVVPASSYVDTLFVVNGSSNVTFHDFRIDGQVALTTAGPGNPLSGTPTPGLAPRATPWSAGYTYSYDSAFDSQGPGGGADTAFDPNTNCVYQAIATSTNQLPSTHPGAWTSIACLTSGASSGGVAFRLTNATNIHFLRVEVTGANFMAYMDSGDNIVFDDVWAHDFGSYLSGNNGTMYAITGAANNVKVINSRFENIYTPQGNPLGGHTTGPGNSAAVFQTGDYWVVSNNHVKNVINRGGGSLYANSSFTGNSRLVNGATITGNIIEQTVFVNADQNDGIEAEVNYVTITGNAMFGVRSGVVVSCLAGTAANGQSATITGNSIYSTGVQVNNFGVAVNACGGGHGYNLVTIGENMISNVQFGIYVPIGSIRIQINATNQFFGVNTNITDGTPGQVRVWAPSGLYAAVGNSTTITGINNTTIQYFSQQFPLSNASALFPGFTWRIHAAMKLTNAGTTFSVDPTIQVGAVYANASVSIPIVSGTTNGTIVIDADVKVQTFASSGFVQVSGIGVYDNGSGVTTSFIYNANLNTDTNNWTFGADFIKLGIFSNGASSITATMNDISFYPTMVSLTI